MKSCLSSRASFLIVLALISLAVIAPVSRVGASGTPVAEPSTAPAGQPGQPATGPGGAELAYDGILAQHFGPQPDGKSDPTGYWLFEPTQPREQTAAGPLPLVLFFHGFDVPSPEWYHAWLDHIVRRGAIVIYPDYQAADLAFTESEVRDTDLSAPPMIDLAISSALAELESEARVQPDLDHVVAVGHSLGALLAADYSGRHPDGLPVPAGLLLVMPGCPDDCDFENVAKLPTTTHVISLVGSQDDLAGEGTAKQIWAELEQIPVADKEYIRLMGDDHGAPEMVADHFVAITTRVFFGQPVGSLDALDFYGPWKWLDALMSCSFASTNCQFAFGDTQDVRFMGIWSDGTPVTEAQVEQNPTAPATPTS